VQRVLVFLCKNIQFTGQEAEQPVSTACLLARKCHGLARKMAASIRIMRHARGQKLQIFRRKCPSIWIFILCSEEQAEAVVFMSKKYDDLEVFRKQDIQQITKKFDFISKKCDEIRDRS
jgi:hypothetical protein